MMSYIYPWQDKIVEISIKLLNDFLNNEIFSYIRFSSHECIICDEMICIHWTVLFIIVLYCVFVCDLF